MTREEAIKIANEMYGWLKTDREKEALETLVPELRESEDEWIRKSLIGIVERFMADERKEKTLAWLEKQKDASKAIEAVEKINEYIDEHLTNAYNMNDSIHDKKYYLGWDSALGKMRRILQDVCSGEKQKEQPKEELVYRLNGLMQEYIKEGKDEAEKEHRLKCYQLFWDALEDTSYFEQEEQKPKIYIPKFREGDEIKLKDSNLNLTITNIEGGEYRGKGWCLDIVGADKSYELVERKPVEIDEYEIIKKHITYDALSSKISKRLTECGWYATNEKQAEWSEEDDKMREKLINFLGSSILPLTYEEFNTYRIWLNSRYSSWKPSKEQMSALNHCAYGTCRIDDKPALQELYEQLKKRCKTYDVEDSYK